jgi:hypothetical protein
MLPIASAMLYSGMKTLLSAGRHASGEWELDQHQGEKNDND